MMSTHTHNDVSYYIYIIRIRIKLCSCSFTLGMCWTSTSSIYQYKSCWLQPSLQVTCSYFCLPLLVLLFNFSSLFWRLAICWTSTSTSFVYLHVSSFLTSVHSYPLPLYQPFSYRFQHNKSMRHVVAKNTLLLFIDAKESPC